MAIANVEISTSTFLEWVNKTNQVLVFVNRLTEGIANSTGTLTLTNAGADSDNVTLNVHSGMIKGDAGLLSNVVLSSLEANTVNLISNTGSILISGGTNAVLGSTVYFDGPAPEASWKVKSNSYTAIAGDQILCNTADSAWTLSLPSTPVLGDVVTVADPYDWTANSLIVSRTTETIAGINENVTMDVAGVLVRFVYDGTTWEPFASY